MGYQQERDMQYRKITAMIASEKPEAVETAL
jgi:hypothetical protein